MDRISACEHVGSRATTAILAVMLLAPMWSISGAQEADGPATQTTSSPSDQQSVARGAGALEEVVVTAQHREETLQKSSLALQVVSPQELEDAGVVRPIDLSSLVPGLEIGMGGPTTQIYIRGVGDFSSLEVTNPAVAFNVDGVYVARPEAVPGNFYDLQRIEVLKGPQGTLYGRNASGGAINVITNQPLLDTFSGYVNVEGGNYSEVYADGALNVPLGDWVAVRGAFQVVNRDAYATDGFDDDHHQAGRLQLLLKPSDTFSVLIGGDYAHFGGKGAAYVLYPPLPGRSPWTSVTSENPLYLAQGAAQGLCIPAYYVPGYVNQGACGAGNTSLITPFDAASAYQDETFWSVHGELRWTFDNMTLTVLPGYRGATIEDITVPAVEFVNQPPETSDETTFETRLSGSTSGWNWVTGLYFYHEDQAETYVLPAGLISNNISYGALGTRSYAAFGQATYSVTNALRLIAGIRYTSDRRTASGYVNNLYPNLGGVPCLDPEVPVCPLETFAGRRTFVDTTWKTGVEYDVSPEQMVYVTVSTGFKAGGFNLNLNTTNPEESSFDPEHLTAYEIGSHNRLLNDRLQVNGEAFYWNYKDAQQPHVVTDYAGLVAFPVLNAASANLYGIDVDAEAAVTDIDRISLRTEYLHSNFEHFGFEEYTMYIPPGSTGCKLIPTTAAIDTVDCAGFPLTHAPTWAGTANYVHHFRLTGGADITASLDVQYATARYLYSDFIPNEQAPSYLTESIHATYLSASGKWSVGVFVRNLSDRPVYTGGYQSPFVGGFVGANLQAPRTYGVRLHVGF